ncbi:NAN1 [Malassezia furfur]|nr:NAN1 [Malassezia furfur]
MPARKKDAKRAGAHAAKGAEADGPAPKPESTTDLPVTVLQDEAASSVPPVFTKDGSYVFVVQHCTVLIVSRATNQVVATLSGESSRPGQRHTAPITGMLLSPFNPLQLLTCSLDGTIKTWDYLDSELHDDMHVGYAVCAMAAHAHWKHRLFVAVSKDGDEADAASSRRSTTVYSVQLGRASAHAHKAVKQVRLGKARQVTHLRVSPDGAWLVALGASRVHILSLHDTSAGFVKYASESRLTALAFHPDASTPRFATGEANGKIRIWYCLEQFAAAGRVPEQATDAVPTTTLHWHAHAVAALQFTWDGAQLLSGGEEGVLVVWKLSSGNAVGADAREFVPRLGAGIVAVAVAHSFEKSEQECVVCLADGSVAFIASLSLRIARVFATVALTAGHPSTLQFVDVAARQHIRDVEVAPSNRVSRPEDEALTPLRVQHVAFSEPLAGATHAAWMATVDGRDGGTYTSELSLKLWAWDAHHQTYVLNTRIDHPHEHGVTAVSFSPRQSSAEFLLVTAGAEGQIKTWRIATRTLKGARAETSWVCRSALAYRGTTPRDIAWAPDGSLFAVAQGVFVTLWDPHTLVMQARLAAPELRAAERCAFVGRHGRYLAALGAARLLVWDLVGQHMVYAAPEAVPGFCTHTYRVPRLLPDTLRNLAPDAHEPRLVALNERGALVALGAARAHPSASLHAAALGDTRATLFDELFGVDAAEHAQIAELLEADQARAQQAAAATDAGLGEALALFSAPPHLLPPVTTLADAYLDALLPRAEPAAPTPAPATHTPSAEAPAAASPGTTPPARDEDQIREARRADLDYLTAAFDALLQPAAGTSPAPAAVPKTKGKRRTST